MTACIPTREGVARIVEGITPKVEELLARGEGVRQ